MNKTNIMQRFNLRRLYPESLTDSLQPGSAQNTVLNIFFLSRLHDYMEDSNDE